MSGDLQIHIGDSLDTMGQRFVDAWHRAEHDVPDADQPERHVGFATFEQFTRIMTPRRLDLLRRVHRAPPRSIRSLALALGGITGGCMRMSRPWSRPGCWTGTRRDCMRIMRSIRVER